VVATILGVIGSYLLGSIPFGFLAGKVLKGLDIRDYGSGNVGATNVLRTLGTKAGIVVLLLDAAKGVAAVLGIGSLVTALSPDINPSAAKALCGAAAIIGHDWTLFLRFKGGKGVATGLGVFFSVGWLYALFSVVLFLVAVILTRHVSVGSLILAVCFPASMLLAGESAWFLGLGLLWLVAVVYLHRQNIQRLIKGTESRIGQTSQLPREHP
jgi:acyl phosphate:glycerol-3-phosphate acyltransferase